MRPAAKYGAALAALTLLFYRFLLRKMNRAEKYLKAGVYAVDRGFRYAKHMRL